MDDTVIVSETPEALAERVAADFAARVKETLAKQSRFSVALAGGVTPKLFYSRLAQEPYKSALPWSKLWFFWGDERCVPKDHSESNFRMANDALLQHISIPPAHILRMQGEDPPPQAARDYEQVLRNFFRESGTWPVFDLIFLGMGPDGHTASLMPGTPVVSDHVDGPVDDERRKMPPEQDGIPMPRWVVHNVVRSLQTVRLTLTIPVFNHANAVWFLVTGSKKKDAFAEVQRGPNPALPASLVRPVEGELRWYVDKAVTENAECVIRKVNP